MGFHFASINNNNRSNVAIFILLFIGCLFNITNAWTRNTNNNNNNQIIDSSRKLNYNYRITDDIQTDPDSDTLNENGMGEEVLYLRPSSGAIRNFRSSFDTIRSLSPYVLRHYLASRFQNPDYLGKRMGSEFLGKKRSNIPSTEMTRRYSSASLFLPYIMEKKMGSEFLAKRTGNYFSKNSNGSTFPEPFMLVERLIHQSGVSKNKKIREYSMRKSALRQPVTFQYYTKGSEFLGGPGR